MAQEQCEKQVKRTVLALVDKAILQIFDIFTIELSLFTIQLSFYALINSTELKKDLNSLVTI